MANLVDRSYVPVYGNVYALADVAICAGFCIGKNFELALMQMFELCHRMMFIYAGLVLLRLCS